MRMTTYAASAPSWVDLVTSHPDGARSFYGEVFGWERSPDPDQG